MKEIDEIKEVKIHTLPSWEQISIGEFLFLTVRCTGYGSLPVSTSITITITNNDDDVDPDYDDVADFDDG